MCESALESVRSYAIRPCNDRQGSWGLRSVHIARTFRRPSSHICPTVEPDLELKIAVLLTTPSLSIARISTKAPANWPPRNRTSSVCSVPLQYCISATSRARLDVSSRPAVVFSSKETGGLSGRERLDEVRSAVNKFPKVMSSNPGDILFNSRRVWNRRQLILIEKVAEHTARRIVSLGLSSPSMTTPISLSPSSSPHTLDGRASRHLRTRM